MRVKLAFIVIGFFIIGAFAAFTILSYQAPATSGVVQQGTGKPDIGGPFSLTDHTGRRVTEKDFKGGLSLVYFGFTYCPDVCPTELQVMADAMDKLGDKASKVTQLFISVDPERDTVEQMASYVPNFHDRLIGLTGTVDEVKKAAKAYKVYYRKVDDKTSDAGYTIDHSSIVFLMNPDGEYLAHFSHGTSPDAMATKIAGFL